MTRTPRSSRDNHWTLTAADDIKLWLCSCYIWNIYRCLSRPACGRSRYCRSEADVSFVTRGISGIFLLPTLTACETCFATEAIINDHSKQQRLRLPFHDQSLPWVLFFPFFFICQHKVDSWHLQMCVTLMVLWIIAFQLWLISLLCICHSLAHGSAGVKPFEA